MKYDAIIIGTGQAGPPLAGKLTKNGRKTAIIEKGAYGGTCVNVGCTPTKAYVASARRAFVAKNSSDLGISVDGNVRVDLKAIKKRKDSIVKESRNGLKDFLENTQNLTVYKGEVQFTGPKSVAVNGEQLHADQIFINTGAKPIIPEVFEAVDYLTNRSILELESVPEHLVILGGSYIGLEFGQMFHRFGSKVTIIEQANQLIQKEDKDIGEAVHDIIAGAGIGVKLNTKCKKARQNGDKITLSLAHNDTTEEITGSHLLIAAGRVPATKSLQLPKTGIQTDDNGYIPVNNHLETRETGIFAMGDCNGEGAFTHTAYNDYEIVASYLFGDASRTLSDRYLCYAAYIDPPVARVGLNAQQIKEKGIPAKIATRPMKRVARAKEMGETDGLLKIFIHAETDKILGASFLGVRADEYIHEIIDVMYADAPYTVIRDAVHIHPTVSELIPTMLEELEPLE